MNAWTFLRRGLGAALMLAASAQAPAALMPIGDPYYAYFFRQFREFQNGPGLDYVYEMASSGTQSGGTLFESHDYGHSMLGQSAQGFVAGYNDGKSFWTTILAPSNGGPDQDLIGGTAEINIAQSFRKDSPFATLDFTFTEAHLALMNYGSGRGDGFGLSAGVMFHAFVVDHASGEQVWTETQGAWLHQDFGELGPQDDNRWAFTPTQDGGPLSSGLPPWQWSCDHCGEPDHGFARAHLMGPYSGLVGIEDIAVGDEFTVLFQLRTIAFDWAQGETAASAYALDPLSIGGPGVGFSFNGLTPTNDPLIATQVPEPSAWALLLTGLLALRLRRRRGQ